jgi:peptidoglycan/xylan/chitin deacetylase (PgdA/CDA1 family)
VQNRLINLTFHGIGPVERALDPGEDRVWVTASRFTAALDAVAGRPDVRITFDDGNASDVTHALPALSERGLTATFFVVAARLGEPHFLSADDVRTLVAAGMTIGSHGLHHRPWRECDDADLEQELTHSRRVLEAVTQTTVDEAACPLGSYDRRVLHALQRAGYERVYTSDRGPARAGDWLQPRTSITPDDPLAPILKTSTPTVRRRAELAVKRWR